MTKWKIAGIAAGVCILPVAGAFFSLGRCVPLTDGAKAKLLAYVGKKYKIPADAGLQLSNAAKVGSGCYRKLEFTSSNPSRPVKISLFATPDLRYLARELLDVTTNPAGGSVRGQRELAGVADGQLPALGPADAPVTVAVFSDFECPYCARFATMMRKDVLSAEGKRVRLVFRQFPLPMHPWARAAAEASLCAYQQKNEYFWDFHDFFFSHQGELTPENLRARVLEHAATISGLDRDRFAGCVSKAETKTAIDREVAFGNDNGIHATPTVFMNGRQVQVSDAAQALALVRQLAQDPKAAVPSPGPAAGRTRKPRPGRPEVPDAASGDLPGLGPANAAVTLTVFSDFQCPYCAKFAGMMRNGVLPVAASQVRMVYRFFPLSIHPWARQAAEAAACAYQQKNEYFWSFHDFFFDHQAELTAGNARQKALEHAGGIAGLDQARFQNCIARDGGMAAIERDVAFGSAHGVAGTPTVFVNGKEIEPVAPEQLLTLIRELTPRPLTARSGGSTPE